jgi:transposase
MAVTEQQVKVYMSQRKRGHSQTTAAAKAGFSERTARRVDNGAAGRANKERDWRTRPDPFAAVWPEMIGQLERDPSLSALTLLEWAQERHPGEYPDKLLRTLQRRVKAWRARFGPDKEVMFPQAHGPGLKGLSDFTQLKRVAITIGGKVLKHRLFHFRLAYSGWSYLRVVLGGESYTALAEGVASALERLGGVPSEHRTDSLSAAFKNLDADEQADVTGRYEAFCHHYAMTPTRNNPGRGHENGSVESPHGHLKRRIRQRLSLRGSCDFDSVADYQAFLDRVVAASNRRNAKRIAAERAALAPLPRTRGVDYSEAIVRVTTSSTFTLRRALYSVPARLIGERLRVHIYDDRLVLHHGGRELMQLPRLRPGPDGARRRSIDYRHVIGWLARKPRALTGLAFRDDLLPDAAWRDIYRRLSQELDAATVAKRVVGALKLAAADDNAEAIGGWWLAALDAGRSPTLIELQARFGAPHASTPRLAARQHPLAEYDTLLKEVSHG